jgi:hypothetical protein
VFHGRILPFFSPIGGYFLETAYLSGMKEAASFDFQ